MNIGGRGIGPNHPPYIIAEIGVNHDGQVDRALELTDAAADAGADAVKLQYFRTDLLMSRAAKLAAYQKSAGETEPVEMLRRLELDLDAMAQVVERAHARGTHAIVTPFSVELVDELEQLGWDAFKMASPDIVHRPLLERIAATGRPMIVSTGASTMEEVERAVGWLESARDRLSLLQCVSSYPTPTSGLGGIRVLRDTTGLPVGYSDHTPDRDTGRGAVALGACILEKHVTYDKHASGPDHESSLWVAALKGYIRLAHEAVELREHADRAVADGLAGQPYRRVKMYSNDRWAPKTDPGWYGVLAAGMNPIEKRVLDCERDVREVSRQSIVTTRTLEPGHTITRDDLTFKRPGIGFEPWRLDEVIGRTTARAVEGDVPITAGDLA